MKLNIGCGKTPRDGWVNMDKQELPGVDIVWDVTDTPWHYGTGPRTDDGTRLRIDNDTFYEAYCSHLLEHLDAPLPFMQELHRVCRPNAIALFRVPYGGADCAFEDPTHQRQYFLQSFGYFSQAAYGGADYGYRGDWKMIERQVVINNELDTSVYANNLAELLLDVNRYRNIAVELIVKLQCIKPIREPGYGPEQCRITFVFADNKSKQGNATRK